MATHHSNREINRSNTGNADREETEQHHYPLPSHSRRSHDDLPTYSPTPSSDVEDRPAMAELSRHLAALRRMIHSPRSYRHWKIAPPHQGVPPAVMPQGTTSRSVTSRPPPLAPPHLGRQHRG